MLNLWLTQIVCSQWTLPNRSWNFFCSILLPKVPPCWIGWLRCGVLNPWIICGVIVYRWFIARIDPSIGTIRLGVINRNYLRISCIWWLHIDNICNTESTDFDDKTHWFAFFRYKINRNVTLMETTTNNSRQTTCVDITQVDCGDQTSGTVVFLELI